jgi:hypothetical protein
MVGFNLTIFKQLSMDFYITMKFGIYNLRSFSYRSICIPQNSTTIGNFRNDFVVLYIWGNLYDFVVHIIEYSVNILVISLKIANPVIPY